MNVNKYAPTPSARYISTSELSRGYTRGVKTPIRGQRIVELRERAKFKTQGDLAVKAGIDASKLSKLENDKPVNLTLKSLQKLAAALRVSVRELFDEPRPEKDVGHGRERPGDEGSAVLEALRLRALEEEAPAEDSARGDILRAQHALASAQAALNRALRRPDKESGAA